MTRLAGSLQTMMLMAALLSFGSYDPRSARAQESPPASLTVPTPLYQAPPGYLAPIDPAELEHRGRRKKVIGAVLMGVGIGMSALGIGLALDGALHAQCSGHEEHAVCEPSFAESELQLGPTALVLGQIMTLVGIPIYIVGGRQVAAARRLSGQLAFQPLVGSMGSGGFAHLDVRF